jgi:TetR/AcrR family transcriptional repressor of bet genes
MPSLSHKFYAIDWPRRGLKGQAMSDNKKGVNQTIQAERQRLLIDATMSAISEHGLTKLTLAKIAAIAGLSAGSVNFHFSSKEALLLATLRHLAEEFAQGIEQALDDSGTDPAQRLQAIFETSLNPEITEPRKMAVWFAFSAESRGRQDYKRICGSQDRKIFDITVRLCDELIHRGGKQDYMNARAMANAVQGLVDEIWEEILYAGDDYDREDGRFIYQSFLASVFPWAFDPPQAESPAMGRLTVSDKSLRVSRAKKEELKELSALFDLYRQFYQQPEDPKLARKYMGDNLRKERSVVYIARDAGGEALGFVQLYPAWCSVAAAPFWTLYDLFVAEAGRKRGIGRALMLAAEQHARKTGASRIDLETATDNYIGQALYEDLGYERDTEFYKYSLSLD